MSITDSAHANGFPAIQSKVVTASWDGLIKLWVSSVVDILCHTRLISALPPRTNVLDVLRFMYY